MGARLKNLAGRTRVELTGADLERTLGFLSERYRLNQIQRVSALVVRFTIASGDWNGIKEDVTRRGDAVKVVWSRGWRNKLREIMDAPVILGVTALLLAASLWIPGRILFIQVEGNELLPERLILEKAEQCGLYFGVSRGRLRSEQIKNRLLDRMPELGWAGVNTTGCVATITVRERRAAAVDERETPGNIVAVCDALVRELTVTAGTPLVREGDGVKAGQVLISGYTDLGLCTHVEAAQGEVYGLTSRKTQGLLPEKTCYYEGERAVVKKYGLLLGKNRINFHSGSGILYIGCGKMTQIRYLTLPGGFRLPLALVTEEYTIRSVVRGTRSPESAREALEAANLAHTRSAMIAGQILSVDWNFQTGSGVYRLSGNLECREMIGRRDSGILTEGDSNDDGENGERGAG